VDLDLSSCERDRRSRIQRNGFACSRFETWTEVVKPAGLIKGPASSRSWLRLCEENNDDVEGDDDGGGIRDHQSAKEPSCRKCPSAQAWSRRLGGMAIRSGNLRWDGMVEAGRLLEKSSGQKRRAERKASLSGGTEIGCYVLGSLRPTCELM
jgi:hypothetical protein